MSGERNRNVLLASMAPVLHPHEFVFCTAPSMVGDPIGAFREAEGWTLILPRAEARRLGLEGAFPSRMITLTIHSSLEAVGLLSAVTAELAAEGIAVNVVSGYYHDHLFVPVDRARDALDALLRTARRNRP